MNVLGCLFPDTLSSNARFLKDSSPEFISDGFEPFFQQPMLDQNPLELLLQIRKHGALVLDVLRKGDFNISG